MESKNYLDAAEANHQAAQEDRGWHDQQASQLFAIYYALRHLIDLFEKRDYEAGVFWDLGSDWQVSNDD